MLESEDTEVRRLIFQMLDAKAKTTELCRDEFVDAIFGDNHNKVVVYRKPTGTYYFEEWVFRAEPLVDRWELRSGRHVGVYDSLETTLREAIGMIPWLQERLDERNESACENCADAADCPMFSGSK